MLGVVRGVTGTASKMRAFPAAVQRLLRCDIPRRIRRFSEDVDILAGIVHLQEQPSKIALETAPKYARRAI